MPQQHVLIVDDSSLVLDILSDAFSGEGFETRVAHDATEAIEMIEQKRPDLIIADIVMPGMDGWSFFEAVRALPQCADVPFVFLTQERALPSRLRGLRAGAQDYITKPFSVEEILARAHRVLDWSVQARPVASGQASPLSGHARLLPIADLLQLLAMNGRTGALRLFGEATGRVFLEDGRIVNAIAGRTSGRKALFRILAWEDVAFRFDAGPAALESVATEIHGSADSVLVEGLVERDELQRLKRDLPGLDQVLSAVTINGGSPVQEPTYVERRVLELAAGAPTFLDVLDQLPESDVAIARAVEALLRRGALEAH
jgi:CheY-like chemotaxis protein